MRFLKCKKQPKLLLVQNKYLFSIKTVEPTKGHGNQITIEVKNPVEWLMEVNAYGGKDVFMKSTNKVLMHS